MSTKPINDDNDIDDIFCTKLGRPTFHRSNRVCKHRIFAFSKCVKIVSLTFYYNNCQFNLNFIPIQLLVKQVFSQQFLMRLYNFVYTNFWKTRTLVFIFSLKGISSEFHLTAHSYPILEPRNNSLQRRKIELLSVTMTHF